MWLHDRGKGVASTICHGGLEFPMGSRLWTEPQERAACEFCSPEAGNLLQIWYRHDAVQEIFLEFEFYWSFTSHSTQNRPFQTRSSQPISWHGTKLNKVRRSSHSNTHKYTTTQKNTRTSARFVHVLYDLRPGHGQVGLTENPPLTQHLYMCDQW